MPDTRDDVAGGLDLDRPFTRAAFLAAGGNPGTLRRKEFMQVMRTVWVRRRPLSHELIVAAALALHPRDAFVSHISAAVLLGLPTPDHPFAHITVTEPQHRRFRPQIKPHVTGRKRRLVHVDGVPVTDPVATFIDCAGWLSLVDLVILGDAIAKRAKTPAADLVRACEASTDYYAGAALVAALLVRDGVDSPMETRVRLLIVLAGLPEPVVNYVVYRKDGTWRRRFDLCYPDIKLIIEFDGRHHAESPEQWHRDLERREEFDDEGYRILVITSSGVFREPAKTLLRIRRQLVERGWPDVPPIDERWREHFAA